MAFLMAMELRSAAEDGEKGSTGVLSAMPVPMLLAVAAAAAAAATTNPLSDDMDASDAFSSATYNDSSTCTEYPK